MNLPNVVKVKYISAESVEKSVTYTQALNRTTNLLLNNRTVENITWRLVA